MTGFDVEFVERQSITHIDASLKSITVSDPSPNAYFSNVRRVTSLILNCIMLMEYFCSFYM